MFFLLLSYFLRSVPCLMSRPGYRPNGLSNIYNEAMRYDSRSFHFVVLYALFIFQLCNHVFAYNILLSPRSWANLILQGAHLVFSISFLPCWSSRIFHRQRNLVVAIEASIPITKAKGAYHLDLMRGTSSSSIHFKSPIGACSTLGDDGGLLCAAMTQDKSEIKNTDSGHVGCSEKCFASSRAFPAMHWEGGCHSWELN